MVTIILPLPRPSDEFYYVVISSCRSLVQVTSFTTWLSIILPLNYVQVRVLYDGYIILPLPRPSESFIRGYIILPLPRPSESFIRGYIILPLPRPSESFIRGYIILPLPRPSESFIRGYIILPLPRPSESFIRGYIILPLPRPSESFIRGYQQTFGLYHVQLIYYIYANIGLIHICMFMCIHSY